MQIYPVGPFDAYASIADALAAIAALPQPLTEIQQIEAKEGIAPETVIIPGSIQPSGAGQLHIVNVDFHRPDLTGAVLDKPHVKFSGFAVAGNVEAGEDGQVVSENVIRGTLEVVGDGATSWSMNIFNNAISDFSGKGLVLRDLRGNIRVLHNSVFAYASGVAPTFAVEIDESDVEMKQNIVAARGDSVYTKAVRLLNASGRTLDLDRNLYFTFDSAAFGSLDMGSGESNVADLQDWKTATGEDADSLFEDPRFRIIDLPSDLDVANSSPAVAAGTYFTDVEIDIDKTRRPRTAAGIYDSTTLGAYEEAERITSSGKTRLLELIGGLSADYVRQAAVGDKGTVSEAEYLSPQTVSALDEELQEQIFITSRVTGTVEETDAVFEVLLGPEPKCTEELLDSIMNTLSEVGLISTDGTLFLRRTLYRIPFDPLGNVTTRLVFKVGICGEDVVPPVLTITAEVA